MENLNHNSILSESRLGDNLQGFRTFRWKSSNQQANIPTETFWLVKSNFKLFSFLSFLKLRVFEGRNSKTEYKCLIDGPGVLDDSLFIGALRALMVGIDRESLFQRIAWVQGLENQTPWTSNLLRQWESSIRYEIKEIRRPIRKARKYSGWIRNSSSVGSKRPGKPKPEPGTFEWNNYEKLDYYNFLTVGRFLGTSVEIFPILTRPERPKR
jgi:hypothetical protein